MASSSKSAENLNKHEKRCTCCGKLRVIENFIRQVGDCLNENATYNACADQKKGKSVNIVSEETTYSEILNLADVDDNISEERILIHFSGIFRLESELVSDILSNNQEENNIENDSFYTTYQKLKWPLITETMACLEALQARHQQKTWNPSHKSKLAFWLQ
ncbi:639_t:CDS:2 [Dentiscutata erythropus]|uniref:639_t:CDS:1 n=1 Tax=Dentiscutata erythropus TaxID=1348616 RepID=A0A9N9N994_9GLOM|nr:639_t:CDS:2 [Dentiscutata erythropus]